eukprot:CAMPEP_0171084876 /NCGR_PEP_ID=MMETSP0766_2-20121228/18587_1 /TAXON_ID=439317 /ORGANISM="Gambierdiscus australes, Strain CAWD 149" /LENGTH=185 /DNA_ID=CAMNT_0011542403 /DNA_START=40 /DNA_END=594 /DNA_ORIENTATION=-
MHRVELAARSPSRSTLQSLESCLGTAAQESAGARLGPPMFQRPKRQLGPVDQRPAAACQALPTGRASAGHPGPGRECLPDRPARHQVGARCTGPGQDRAASLPPRLPLPPGLPEFCFGLPAAALISELVEIVIVLLLLLLQTGKMPLRVPPQVGDHGCMIWQSHELADMAARHPVVVLVLVLLLL